MGKLRVLCILLIMVAAISATIAVSYASLISTSFGFPVIAQTGTTTAFSQDTASATDLEALNINFPTLSDGQGISSTGINTAPSGIGSMNMFNSLGVPSAVSPFASIFGGNNFFSGL